jgi:hypothetical protein
METVQGKKRGRKEGNGGKRRGKGKSLRGTKAEEIANFTNVDHAAEERVSIVLNGGRRGRRGRRGKRTYYCREAQGAELLRSRRAQRTQRETKVCASCMLTKEESGGGEEEPAE